MKKTLFGYYRLTDDEFSDLWESCVFVLDANVLLNLYRYPQGARSDLLKILRSVSERLWIPHQAALEYQENRLSVIAEQVRTYTKTQGGLDRIKNELHTLLDPLKKKHSRINPENFLSNIDKNFQEFSDELGKLEEEQPDVSDDDKLRDEIDSLFKGRVGPPPESQAELNKIYEEGQTRYQQERPPGYMDEGKAETYLYGDLCLERKYGDWILWYQIMKEAQTQDDFSKIILITDDDKEDWWWTINSKGKKTIGPRPELVEEISSRGGVSLFYMYNSERFMRFSKDYLKVEIKPESIGQVQDLLKSVTERGLTAYPRLTNKELRDRTMELVAQIHDLLAQLQHEQNNLLFQQRAVMMKAQSDEEKERLWNEHTNAIIDLSTTFMQEFNKRFKIEAILLRDEMLSRLPEAALDSRKALFYDLPTNPLGIEEVVSDLERLAKTLP